MKNIHAFIFCSSLMLTAWLAASYSAELDLAPDTGPHTRTAPTATHSPAETTLISTPTEDKKMKIKNLVSH